MKLLTRLKLKPQDDNLIDYNSTITAIGSCFVENIGAKLDFYKFKNLVNPFGILFNPKAIENILQRSLDVNEYVEDELQVLNDVWSCSDAHSRLNSSTKEGLLLNLNTSLFETKSFLLKSTHIILTVGTAWVYRDVLKNKVVANCHKRPQSEFSKELLEIEDITGCLNNSIKLIRAINKNASIIFTVSPVRHLKDGIVENNRSKAHLLSSIHRIIETNTNCFYFPAYEFMMDELRDYRFYDRDMIHPNQLSIDYIWDQFKDTWIASDAYEIMKEVNKIQTAILHRPFNQESLAHQKFINNIEDLKKKLTAKFPHIQF